MYAPQCVSYLRFSLGFLLLSMATTRRVRRAATVVYGRRGHRTANFHPKTRAAAATDSIGLRARTDRARRGRAACRSVVRSFVNDYQRKTTIVNVLPGSGRSSRRCSARARHTTRIENTRDGYAKRTAIATALSG